MTKPRLVAAVFAAALTTLVFAAGPALASSGGLGPLRPTVGSAVAFDVSPALRDMPMLAAPGSIQQARGSSAPRDRSLVTISALIANGQTAQLTPHLNRAMDNGLSQAQASEAITHLAFYVGWPNVFSAMPIAKDVFAKRPQ